MSKRHGSISARAYLLLLFSLPLLYILVAVLVVPTNWAHRHEHNSYSATMGYADRLSGKNCEVVIYGDSGALGGIRPSIIEQETGLTTCNISEFEGVTTVLGTDLLNDYLKRNARPKYIVFAFGPDNFTPEYQHGGPTLMDCILYALRMHRNLHTAVDLARFPAQVLGALERGLVYLTRDLRKPPLTEEQWTIRERNNGWFPYPNVLPRSCPMIRPLHQPMPAWVEGLRQKYATAGTKVLVLGVPVPDCDPWLPQHLHTVSELADAPELVYPTNEFSGASAENHLVGVGVDKYSRVVAEHILAAEKAAQP